MLSGLSPESIFHEVQGSDDDMDITWGLTAADISQKLKDGHELTNKGQAIVKEAREIKDYYIARLVEEKLTNNNRKDSLFATDLVRALNTKGTIEPQYAGIYHKLQDFYRADITWDKFVGNFKSVSNQHEFASVTQMTATDIELKFTDHIYSSSNKSVNNKTNYCRYYFTDRYDYLYEYSIHASNQLRPFIENYFQTFSEATKPWKNVKIFAKREVCPVPLYRNEFNYFKIFGWAGLMNSNVK